jgi:hypothetical protein
MIPSPEKRPKIPPLGSEAGVLTFAMNIKTQLFIMALDIIAA